MINERNYEVGKSPYDSAYIMQYDEGEFSLERRIPIPIVSNEDKTHTLMDGETLQSIAYRYYGDSGNWYKIAEANGIMNPLSDTELFVGRQLRIPLYGIAE